jgi:membrane protease subunit HflC
MRTVSAILIVVAGLAVITVFLSAYIVSEVEQVIITQFGRPVGEPVTEAGLHFKTPFIQKANRFDKRWLEWDGSPEQLPTRNKKFIWLDTFARWRIADPLLFFKSVRDERSAQSRLDDILDGAARDAVANYDLIELVRGTNREMIFAEELADVERQDIRKVEHGRKVILAKILEQARKMAPQYGIELVDVRIKRLNYVESDRKGVYARMISERKRIANKYRSQGQGKSAEIRGRKERDLKTILSEAYRKAEEIRGRADAEATKIYADAYNRGPDFYSFTRTLDTYKETFGRDTWLILSTDGDLLKYLQKAGENGD